MFCSVCCFFFLDGNSKKKKEERPERERQNTLHKIRQRQNKKKSFFLILLLDLDWKKKKKTSSTDPERLHPSVNGCFLRKTPALARISMKASLISMMMMRFFPFYIFFYNVRLESVVFMMTWQKMWVCGFMVSVHWNSTALSFLRDAKSLPNTCIDHFGSFLLFFF